MSTTLSRKLRRLPLQPRFKDSEASHGYDEGQVAIARVITIQIWRKRRKLSQKVSKL